MIHHLKVITALASLIAIAITLASCSPKVQSKEYKEAQQIFTTLQQDQKLDVKETAPEELLQTLSAEQNMKTSELFRSVGGLYSLAAKYEKPQLKILANGINSQFYSALNTTAKVRFEASPVIQMGLGMGKQYINIVKRMGAALEGQPTQYAFPTNVQFETLNQEIEKYLDWVVTQAASNEDELALLGAGKAKLLEQIKLEDRATAIIAAVSAVKAKDLSASDAMMALSDVLDSLAMDLEDPRLARLNGYITALTALATEIDAISDEATLKAAIEKSKPFFEEAKLKAVKKDNVEIGKKMLIGLVKSSSLNKVESALPAVLMAFPGQLVSLGASLVGFEEEQMKALMKNPETEIKKLAAQFGETNLASSPAGITGVESHEIEVNVQSNNLKIAGKRTEKVVTSAEAIGASLTNSIKQVEEADKEDKSNAPETKTLLVSQFNKLVLLGGFKSDDNQVTSYTVAQNTNQPVEILSKEKSASVAAVGDQIKINRNLSPIPSATQSVSVRGQAALLQGLSDMLLYLRDWKENGFDQGLGQTTAAQLLNVESELLADKKVFDKSLLFSLTLANAGAILENCQKKGSPVYLIGLDEPAVWADERAKADSNGNKIADSRAMAGLVDIVDGERKNVTRTGDLARFIIALTSFLNATEGIEETKSELLTEAELNEKSKVQQLVEAKADLRMLLLAMSNMLSHNLQRPDGTFAAEFNKRSRASSGQANAVDSAVAIQALVKASNTLDAKVYKLSALDGYYAMNKTLWNSQTKFYNREGGKAKLPSYDELISILSSIEEVAPYMPDESRTQWKTIAKNWVGALELLSKNLEAARQ
jgi:hypothetical protein